MKENEEINPPKRNVFCQMDLFRAGFLIANGMWNREQYKNACHDYCGFRDI